MRISFIDSPWCLWGPRRVWIVQEAAFSKELHLLYGDICIDWDSVGEGLAVLWQRLMLDNVPGLGGSYFSDDRKRVFAGLCNVDTMLEFRGNVNFGRVFTLSMTLQNCVGFQRSNKRDKIYAIGNLVEEPTIFPDYSMDIPTVYIQTMKDILLRSNSLDVMSFAGTGHGPRVVEPLPTWVSDWDGDTRVPRHHTSYSAGSVHDPVIPVILFDETDLSVLYLQGWERDRVGNLTEILELSANRNPVENNHILRTWYAEAEDMAIQHAMRYGEETLLESFVRTVLGNRISERGDRPARAECLEKYGLLQQ
ncbi:heterokaryon incompatibility protein [Fusarium mundagurra]|uniref:Heterokaryon incompatibility protein n=1 Tax=Fusarium mundagurra TaxID=1567541 RepID=A0A8H5YTF8_9HYPO|nr:heterokaryon incompatibility protein [Fusarium mundagurra]